MASTLRRISLAILMGMLQTAHVQMPMPMPMCPGPICPGPPPPPTMYMVQAPPPVGIPMPYPVPVPIIMTQKPTTTTTTTKATPKQQDEQIVAFPYPVPMPVPFAVPPAPPPMFCANRPRSPGCPPCPPCSCSPTCTPAFYSYCSPCHQQCRCRGPPGPPMMPPMLPPPPPMPIYPLPPPVPPVVVIPFPPPPRRRPMRMSPDCGEPSKCSRKWDRPSITSSDDSTDDSDTGDSRGRDSSGYWHKRSHSINKRTHPKRRLDHIYGNRRFMASRERSDDELVRPVLSYLSRNGDVRFQKRITSDEAASLMKKKTVPEGSDDERSSIRPKRLMRRHEFVLTNEGGRRSNPDSRRRSGGRRGNAYSRAEPKAKELVFRPAGNKKISNLSVSFLLD